MKRLLEDEDDGGDVAVALAAAAAAGGLAGGPGGPGGPAGRLPPLDTSLPPTPRTEIDSPFKRCRSTPPPALRGPLYFTVGGELAPSTLPRPPSNMPGVRRLQPREAPVRLTLPGGAQLDTALPVVLSALAPRAVLVFESANERAPPAVLALPELAAAGLVVCDVPPSAAAAAAGLPTLEDPSGALARECRVLDPLGGGRAAAACLVLVESGELRATAMLGRSAAELQRTLQYWL